MHSIEYTDHAQSPFDVVRLVFAPRNGNKELSLSEKSDLFFHDYSMAALFVQENYLSAKPASARCVQPVDLVTCTVDNSGTMQICIGVTIGK